ncbi:hypothetical protein M0534_05105 [Methylonatrum kenyense]|uniref:hypothetical protein n=1 Tax=Methylonatrum kenyense TaxID=455253 RepID=UPI0020BD4749|nr:hypothetical protein [Methylonatrum kenyense]MCK8515704.1 hypothetical protein [Methylonatrum kenyense]
MSRKRTALALSLGLLFAGGAAAETLPHRDDFKMNSIGGGDFRDYVMEHVSEDDGWAQLMQTIGVLHNHMHEIMSDFARHARDETGDDQVPAFGTRISGGQWSDYRAGLEDAETEGPWRDLVQITEIMHDRVHHMMVSAVFYDQVSRQRDLDLEELLGERAPHDQADTLPAADTLAVNGMAGTEFRRHVWTADFEEPLRHAMMQKVTVFDSMMDDVMTQLAQYGLGKLERDCRPPDFGSRMNTSSWANYAERVSACEEEQWQDLVLVTGLARDRIDHMLSKLHAYDTAGD